MPQAPSEGTAPRLPLILQSTFGYLSTHYIDAFFIVRWLSTASLGIYNITYQMMGSFLQLAVLAGSLVLPFLISLESTNEHDSETLFLEETLPALCWGFSLACMLVAGAIVVAIPVLLPVSFGPAVELVWPMFAAAALAGPLVLGFAPLAMARYESRISAATAFVAACCNVVLNFALIPRFGLLGCVWATTASNFVTMAAAGFMVTRVRAFRYWRSILAALPPTLAAVAASHLPGGVSRALLAIVAGGVALVVVGYGSHVSLSRVARSLQHALAAR